MCPINGVSEVLIRGLTNELRWFSAMKYKRRNLRYVVYIALMTVFISADFLSLTGELSASSKITLNAQIEIATPDYMNHTPIQAKVDGDYLYASSGYNGVQIYDISDPQKLMWVNRIDTDCIVIYLDVSDDYLYAVCMNNEGFKIIDISSLEKPEIITEYSDIRHIRGIKVKGDYAYVITVRSLDIIDISDKHNPRNVKAINTGIGGCNNIWIHEELAYISKTQNIMIYDIADPENSDLIQTIGIPDVIDIRFDEKLAIINGQWILDISNPGEFYVVDEITREDIWLYPIQDFPQYSLKPRLHLKVIEYNDNNHYYHYTVSPYTHDTITFISRGNYQIALDEFSALMVLDVADHEAISVIDYHFTPRNPIRIHLHDDRAIVMNGERDLYLYKIDGKMYFEPKSSLRCTKPVIDIAVSGDCVYLLHSDQIQILEISMNLDIRPIISSGMPSERHPSYNRRILGIENRFFLIYSFDRNEPPYVDVFKISDNQTIELVKTFELENHDQKIIYAVDNSQLIYEIRDEADGNYLKVIDIHTGKQSSIGIDSEKRILAQDIHNETLYLVVVESDNNYSIQTLDYMDSEHPVLKKVKRLNLRQLSSNNKFLICGSHAVLRIGEHRLHVYDLNETEEVEPIFQREYERDKITICVDGNYLYYGVNRQGLNVIRLK